MAREVIVATFDTRAEAYDAAMEIDVLDVSVADVKRAVIVEKDPSGKLRELESLGLSAPWGAVGGATGGALLAGLLSALAGPPSAAAGPAIAGALVGGSFDVTAEVTEAEAGLMAGQLPPGRVAVLAEIEETSTSPVNRAVQRHGGVIFRQQVASLTAMHEPADGTRYEIRVRGVLGETLIGAFPGLTARTDRGETVLSGTLPDQAALHGVLGEIEALNLELIEVRRG